MPVMVIVTIRGHDLKMGNRQLSVVCWPTLNERCGYILICDSSQTITFSPAVALPGQQQTHDFDLGMGGGNEFDFEMGFSVHISEGYWI